MSFLSDHSQFSGTASENALRSYIKKIGFLEEDQEALNLEIEAKDKPLSVKQLSMIIKNAIEGIFDIVSVEGEISNLVKHSSGHKYFSLKDGDAVIKCVLWKSKPVSFQLENGTKVIIRGKVTAYSGQSTYQIDCHSIKLSGEGDIYKQLERLKLELADLGYYDSYRKKKIPAFPTKIGVSTSPTGAAVQDILSTIASRYAGAIVYFRPTLVQGDGSANDIANAIKELNDTDCDLIIIGRGGGSIEDLWSYNSRLVADAIFYSPKPIISGVGHESDITIADLVADYRAETPTAAAVKATPFTSSDINQHLNLQTLKLHKLIKFKCNQSAEKINALKKIVSERRLIQKINHYRENLDNYENSIHKSVNHSISINKERLKSFEKLLNAKNPIKPLEKGYAILEKNGKIISKTENLNEIGEFEVIRLNDRVKVKIQK